MIGIKTIINEFAAYDQLGKWTRECTLSNGDWDENCPYITLRSQQIASFGKPILSILIITILALVKKKEE